MGSLMLMAVFKAGGGLRGSVRELNVLGMLVSEQRQLVYGFEDWTSFSVHSSFYLVIISSTLFYILVML